MIRISNIKFPNNGFEKLPQDKKERLLKLKSNLIKKSAKLLQVQPSDIKDLTIHKHSIDARKKPEILDIYSVNVCFRDGLNEEKILKRSGCKNAQTVNEKRYKFPDERKADESLMRNVTPQKPIIIGSGPAGLFCAYELAKAGYSPIVLERGMDVDERVKVVNEFWETGILNTKCNVQFGEGGAGTFSDGKLNTMVKDKDGKGYRCLEIFVENGASEDILYDAKPHIGTDVLTKVVKNMRKRIISLGGEYFFETKATELLFEDVPSRKGSLKYDKKICGVRCEDGREFYSDIVVLAIGHSARDTFAMLHKKGITMEQKAFAVGLRVEHRQSIINKSQYGIDEPVSLPPTPYKVTAQCSSGYGVYSFCMCPGGYVVNASSEEGRLVVNGMSYSGRDSKNANSAIVVTVDTKDFGSSDVLAGMEFQRRLEEKAFATGNGKIPVEYFDDFKKGTKALKDDDDVLASIKKHAKADRNTPCVKGDYVFAPVHRILPENINSAIVEGMEHFGRMIKGFDDDEALFLGVETRTSSPVRINRDEDLEAIGINGLYPCGEGAGYAGGITSAAMDGMKVAERIGTHYHSAKFLLRRKMIERRNKLSIAEKEKYDDAIFNNLTSSDSFKNAEDILIFCSTDVEADTHRIIEHALYLGKKVYCPRILDRRKYLMEFFRVDSLYDFEEGSYGISEPVNLSDDRVYDFTGRKTFIVLPGLVFDKKGNRIGYGAGFYDRYIIRFFNGSHDGMIESKAIGYDFQVTDDDLTPYMNSMDIPVSAIITNSGEIKNE
ncbi:5-formyltetrahydrofolate cyclo-ligase [Butyrivibrio sp. AE3006]|uniref:5-formyltetrahydrofolate cyclo-ligase n=1 Tax=Butyrivibrio sp. AE3006 TaxID=1280673 RepID=UPI000406EA81|nr:5-formyltetrahydrofolate cyclo-ligase [Butyrivibrio sp. AE3006]